MPRAAALTAGAVAAAATAAAVEMLVVAMKLEANRACKCCLHQNRAFGTEGKFHIHRRRN